MTIRNSCSADFWMPWVLGYGVIYTKFSEALYTFKKKSHNEQLRVGVDCISTWYFCKADRMMKAQISRQYSRFSSSQEIRIRYYCVVHSSRGDFGWFQFVDHVSIDLHKNGKCLFYVKRKKNFLTLLW